MLTAVRWYRVMVGNDARGPWRAKLDEARRDALDIGLGSYDEYGQWYDTVPGRIVGVFVLEDQAAA
jgi:hypothetical protein